MFPVSNLAESRRSFFRPTLLVVSVLLFYTDADRQVLSVAEVARENQLLIRGEI